MSKPNRSVGKLEGEGSYTASRKYGQNLAEFQRKEDVTKLAEDARRAVSGPKRAELERAEQRGKAGPSATRKPARPQRSGRSV